SKTQITAIEEKPKNPKSNYAVTGIYMYDAKVFDFIRGLKKSRRGEYEITDINNAYLKEGLLTYDIVKGFWTDAGTFESLLKANLLVAKKEGMRQEDLL
ncbi:MAG: sugar phosphate nucleotidyltransferase, partial [Candidatus Omnitrophica bacterium]|nr:sugar phosphate nucleotidyltransferase [Candidatus Omnitrophota bacterium]